MVALTSSGAVPLLDAPQGGDVLFAAARIKNVDSCGMNFTGDLRDPGTNRVIGLEGRPVNLRLASDGFLEPADPQSLSDWSNIPVCPSAAATRAIVGSAYLLELKIEDGGGRTAFASMTVVPFCGNPSTADYCHALCNMTNGSM